jgi:hypothetical protein
MTTRSYNTRPLNWSLLSAESITYDSLKSLCNAEMLEYEKLRRVIFDPQSHLEPSMICRLIIAWNMEATTKTEVMFIRPDGSSYPIVAYSSQMLNPVYIRLNNDRWEGCGYFQDPVPSTSSLQPSNAMSAISQIDIEPVTKTEALVDDLTEDSAPSADTTDQRAIESLTKFTRKYSIHPVTSIRTLCCWIAVLGLSHDVALQPRIHGFLKLVKLGKTALDITRVIRDDTTDEEKNSSTTKWQERLQQELKAHAKQNGFKSVGKKGEEEEAKQSEGEDVKQKQDEDHKQEQGKTNKRERDEDVKQREDEDAKQKEREEAQAIAAGYTAQDRYDSCSDSDGE